jgi:hypothetical protein
MFEIVMFRNAPFDSVPSLMRPVGPSRSGAALVVRPYVPSSIVPTSNPLTTLFVIVTFSVGRAAPSAKELLRTMASSFGAFTDVFEMRTLRHTSMSIPSRFVSIVRLSIVRLSTPVARIAMWPPRRMVKSRSSTLRESRSAIALFACPGRVFTSSARPPRPRLSFVPSMRPRPVIETSSTLSPQIRLLCQ